MEKMGSATLITAILATLTISECMGNLPPSFTDDMNNHVIPENTPIGTAVYTLKGLDPEKAPLKYGLIGTDRLRVDESTGIVTVAKPIDREAGDRLKISVTVEDQVPDGENNLVTIPVSVTISDSNDNAPKFINQSIYENVEVLEDTPVGASILSVDVHDPDLTGMALSVKCVASSQSPEACEIFPVKIEDATAGVLKGQLVLGKKLDFNKRSLYQFNLVASDGEHTSKVGVLIRIRDVQNSPPVFIGAMAGRVMEDAPVGSLVMLLQARDGDLGKPRAVRLGLRSNPGEVFQLDGKSGRLTTTRPLDREKLGSLLTLEVQAEEVPESGPEGENDVLVTIRNVTVLIDDVNDSEPTFNRKEYHTEIPENSAVGTPLPELDMSVTDADTGTFADFTLRIEGPLADLFDIQPRFASGSVKPVIRVKKSFDHENPNERKFILLLVAQNTDEPELFSTATVTVTTLDENDNRPKFDRDVYQIRIPEDTPEGTKIGEITAEDPDSGDFGERGLVYQLIGTGSKRFIVNNRTGEIFVAPCSPEKAVCLDYETQKTYDLLYMASDSHRQEGFIKSLIPLQILLTDSNDNPVYFEEGVKHYRKIPENSRQFEPPFFILAKDEDDSAVITYEILSSPNSTVSNYFKIDENTGELSIRKGLLPPSNYSFKVEASDGIHSAFTPVFIQVTDLNNHYPKFTARTLEAREISVSEDAKVGTVILTVRATDEDMKDNGLVHYFLEKGGLDHFEIDRETGEISLTKELDDEVTKDFELVVTAQDEGMSPLRTTTNVLIRVVDVYRKLPSIVPSVQRVQVSESAEIGDLVAVIKTSLPDTANLTELGLQFDFVDPIEARNPDNMQTNAATTEMARDWFRIDPEGRVTVASALQRELVTAMNFTVMLTSERARPGSKELATLMITIFEVNDKPPTVEDMEIEILEELPPGQAILTLEAEDPEGGQISHYYIEQGSELFSIDNKTGEVKVKGRLDYERQPVYNVTVVAVDSGVPQLSATATIMVSLVNDNDNDPVFSKNEFEAVLPEHPEKGKVVTQVVASDLDLDSTITYEIVDATDPFMPAFEINVLGELIVTKEGTELIDRDIMEQDYITLSIKATDGERFGYTSVRIFVQDRNDNAPKFETKTNHITVHAPLRAKQEILRVPAVGGDLPSTDRMSYRIMEGNEEGLFEIEKETGIIRAAQAHNLAGEVKLTVEVNDLGVDGSMEDETHKDQTSVLVQILPGNFRKPEFMFPNRMNSTLLATESDSEEREKFSNSGLTKVLGQILAFDSDEGDAGKISFYFKDGDTLVTETEQFRIESETGKVHQIRPLDREHVNKYDLVVVAKDNGIPVSSESQAVLTIQVQDIDDHKPHFVQRHYDFSIKENSAESSFIGQVQAVDEDEGRNADIFYFLVSEEHEKHLKEDFRVDIKSGMIHTNKILDRERMERYRLYVRASASPIISKSMEIVNPLTVQDDPSLTSLNISILDENDNSPRFPERQYYAAINSEAEPGREIMTLQSLDLDSPSTSPIQYSLLGAYLVQEDNSFRSGGSVIPSPFRIDSHTGRLTLSQSAMRQYSGGNNRFQVKVSVRETVPPYHSDTTQVQVWVVESAQETVLTVKAAPKTLVKEGLIETLNNITGSHVLITKIVPHVQEDFSVNKEWSDIYVTAVDKNSFQILPVPQFLQALDLGHDQLKNADMPIVLHSAVPAVPTLEGEGNDYFLSSGFDAAFAGLIALIALLCMGLAAIIACCCCINRMYDKDNDSEKQTIYGPMKHPLHASHASIPGTPSMGIRNPGHDMIEDMATDNPLWIDQTVKTYEEQELSMQVASELDNSNGSEEGEEQEEEENEVDEMVHKSRQRMGDPSTLQLQGSPQFSHAYATLHPHPRPYRGALGEEYDQVNVLGEDTIAVHL